ncbi:tyrosine-type recombinase/integrase [Niveibacterium sp. 24ML]|uniref:tyrosine-type recombinase/integrase n=1 Tax=Niveibacterium sp. 24ML TaxID=2985512 RepID=UPI0022702202|nr:tyrosine-type recombinase/integrase [Niveibacterium sp. 24ML]MCX9157192.1 tyrosine-type recombinase/integrase [Niveibacterium sp. 24ML]
MTETIQNVTMDSKTRGRYVFQMRIPSSLRTHFSGRASVRKVLGRISASEARERGAALATEWRARFAKLKARIAPLVASGPRVVLELSDAPERARLVATCRALKVEVLHVHLAALRASPDTNWTQEEELAQSALADCRKAARSGSRVAAMPLLDEIEARYSVIIDAQTRELPALIDAVNADAVLLAEAWFDVLQGRRALATLAVHPQEMLALTRIAGTRASALLDLHEARLAAVGKSLLRDTRQKYVALTTALGTILGERPVEHLAKRHVSALLAHWRECGNGTKTILDKMGALAMLVSLVSERAAAVVRAARPQTAAASTPRDPMPRSTLRALRNRLIAHGGYSDDVALVDLMSLTGARLGEILQLQAHQVVLNGVQAVVVFDGPRMKTSASRRQIPVLLEGLPALQAWLAERLAQGGALFPAARPDARGRLGNAESKRINRALRALCPDRHIVLESTRNAAARTLRRGGVDPRVRRRALGHRDVDVHEQHYDPAARLDDEDLASAAPVLNAALRAACESRHESANPAVLTAPPPDAARDAPATSPAPCAGPG